MLSGASSTVAYIIGWQFIPNFATRQALEFFHSFLRSRGRTPPERNSPQWYKHYRYTYALVVLGYLVYNLLSASWNTPANFYEILGVHQAADENTLKLAFRSFARKFHPDRVGPQGEAVFIMVRDAYESLKNPTTRFAYDRFGPDAMKWADCKTPREFIHKGLMRSAGFYIVSSGILVASSAALEPSPVAFWRYLLLLTLFASELGLVLDNPFTVQSNTLWSQIVLYLFPFRVAFQHILLLHQLWVFFAVGLSRVVPVLFPADVSEDPRAYAPIIQRLTLLAQAADSEASRVLHTELHSIHGTSSTARFTSSVEPPNPCVPSDDVLDKIAKEMEDMVMETELRRQLPIKSLWEAAIERRRKEWVEPDPYSSSPDTDAENIDGVVGTGGRLISPISPVELYHPKTSLSLPVPMQNGAGSMLSPRPSPEPQLPPSSPRKSPQKNATNSDRNMDMDPEPELSRLD